MLHGMLCSREWQQAVDDALCLIIGDVKLNHLVKAMSARLIQIKNVLFPSYL